MVTVRARVRTLLAVALALAMAAVLLPATAPPVQAAPNTYVEMSDGVKIAVNVRMPDGYVEGERYPVLFEMSGYDGGSATDEGAPDGSAGSRGLSRPFNEDYVTIHASIRGTGCSEGEFDLFSWRSAIDGYELIEWAAAQDWADGSVAIYGHSYGGITGFMVAATRPPSLGAVTVSGLIDDLYRGIVYPGGVSNYGFPLIWTGAVRPVYDVGGGVYPGLAAGDEQCARNQATKSRTVLNDPILQGIDDTDNDWWRARALMTHAERIEVPVHITAAYQDEQTGARGPFHLFELVSDDLPKRMLMSNGNHGTQTDSFSQSDRKAWVDHWLRGIDGGFGTLTDGSASLDASDEEEQAGGEDDEHPGRSGVDRARDAAGDLPARLPGDGDDEDAGDGDTDEETEPHRSVITRFELAGGQWSGLKESTDFPLPDTEWTDLYLREGGGLSLEPPTETDSSSSYLSGTARQSWSYQAGHTFGAPFTTADAHGVDELVFATDPAAEDAAIAGPITATLHVASTTPDTELFVQLIDEAPDGTRLYLQRGLLKASHRAIHEDLSQRTEDGRIYRPHRPHTNPTLITPGETYEYLVEVWPVGHILREGHRLVVKVHAPPAVDSYYIYVPDRPVGMNTVFHDADRPSSLMVPFVPIDFELGDAPAPCSQTHVRCVPGS